MTNQLKTILIQIAKLPANDQRWILRQLSSPQRQTLKKYNGVTFLKEALRFRQPQQIPQKVSDPLPPYSHALTMKKPLFTAIVLEQGEYDWTPLFLQQFDRDGTIQRMLENHVLDIKPVVKAAVFNEWTASISFESHLDNSHG